MSTDRLREQIRRYRLLTTADLRGDRYGLWEVADGAKAITDLSAEQQRAEAQRLVSRLLQLGWITLLEADENDVEREVPAEAAVGLLGRTRAWDTGRVISGAPKVFIAITPKGKSETTKDSPELDAFLGEP